MAEKMARLGATAFAVGLLLAGPQAAGVAVADRGEAGASASDDTRGSASEDDSAGDEPDRSDGPEAPSGPAGEDESDAPDVEVSVDDSDVDVEVSVDDPDVEISVEETQPSPGEPEIPPVDDTVEDTVDDPVDDTGEDAPAEEPITEPPAEIPPAEPIAEESTDPGDPWAGDDPTILDDPIEDGVPGRGGPDPLPWWRTTTVDDGSDGSDGLDVVWNYNSGPVEDGPVALPVAVPDAPEPLAGTADGPAGQIIATLKMRVAEALDLALNWLSGLPSTRFTEFLSGALLLVRRTLLPDIDVSQDTGGPGATEPATELPEGLVGLTEAAAVDAAESGGWVARVVARDGEYFPVTFDYVTSRVNLTLVGGIVTSVSVG